MKMFKKYVRAGGGEEQKVDRYFEELKASIENGKPKIDELIIDEIYKISYENLKSSEESRENLENKASLLIKSLGLCFTILFALGSLGVARFPAAFVTVMPFSIAILILLTFGSLLYLIGFASNKILKPTSHYRVINVADITNEKFHKTYLLFKFYLSWHYWRVYESNSGINEAKGFCLERAYELLWIPLSCIFATILIFIFRFL